MNLLNANQFKIFLGIDQTGATDHKGKPKKLSCTLIDARSFQKKKKLKIHTALVLKSLNYASIKQLLSVHIKNFENQPVLICIDTAFGLPIEHKVHYKKIFEYAKNYHFNSKDYGATTAYHFFNSFRQNEMDFKRNIDKITSAHSVFNLMPFQKNIGCGSYRSIKELSQDMTWFNLWPFEKIKKQFVIAEGYPSYYWKKLFNFKNRNLVVLQKKFPYLNLTDLNQADSFLLAYGAMKFQSQLFETSSSIAKKEGWILGVPYK